MLLAKPKTLPITRESGAPALNPSMNSVCRLEGKKPSSKLCGISTATKTPLSPH